MQCRPCWSLPLTDIALYRAKNAHLDRLVRVSNASAKPQPINRVAGGIGQTCGFRGNSLISPSLDHIDEPGPI
jgi:hypothetical protein